MNIVILKGRITSEINQFGNDRTTGVAFTLVTSKPVIRDGKPVKDENGYTQTYDQWHKIKAFNGLGKAVANNKKKGDHLLIRGEIQYSRTEKDGQTYYNTDIIADEIEFI